MTEAIGAAVSLCLAAGYLALFWFQLGTAKNFSSLAVANGRRLLTGSTGFGLLFWTSPIFLLSVFGIASYSGVVGSTWVPSPHRVILSLFQLISSGILLTEAWASIQRIIIGFSAASVGGVTLGLLAGSFTAARVLILPTNSFLRYIPPTAFIALLIVYFGVGETYKYAVIFFGVVFFIVQMVVDVIDDMDIKHVEMGRTCDLSNTDVFRQVIVPYSTPRIFDVLRINLSAAWTFLVAAELIGADHGLGHLIAISQRFLRIDDLYVGILTFGVIGLVIDVALEFLSQRWFRWYYVSLGR